MFLAAGGGIGVFSRGAAVLLQRALLGGQLWDAAASLRRRLPSGRRRRVGFRGVGAERAGGLRQTVDLSRAGRLLRAVHLLHEDGAVVGGLRRPDLVNAVPSVGRVSVQRGGVVKEGGGLDQVAFGAVGREPITNLREGQGGLGVRAV